MRLFNAFLNKQEKEKEDIMLISKKAPVRNVRYGRPSTAQDEASKRENTESSRSKDVDTQMKTQSQLSSSQSNGRPKPRPSQPGSTLDFQSKPNLINGSSSGPLFRDNHSDTDSDLEMQDVGSASQSNAADDTDTEEEDEIEPIPSGSRKRRSKVPKKAVPSSSDNESAAKITAKTSNRIANNSTSCIIEISSDEADEIALPARERRDKTRANRRVEKKITNNTRAQDIVHGMDEEEEMGEWNREDAEDWYEYFAKVTNQSNDKDFDIEKVIRWRRHPRRKFIQYRVKWKGYRDWSNTWEPGKNFETRHCIDEFWRLQKKMYGFERPANTHKKDDHRIPDSVLDNDSDDTDQEIIGDDSERKESACKRRIDDIRRDRFKWRELKLYTQGKNYKLAKPVRQDGDDSSAASSIGPENVLANSDTVEHNKHVSTSHHSTVERQASSDTLMEAFIVTEDGDDDDDDGEYVDSLENDYVPLPKSNAAIAFDKDDMDPSPSSPVSRSSAGEASLQLASSPRLMPSSAGASSTKTPSVSRSNTEELQVNTSNRKQHSHEEKIENEFAKERTAYAATFTTCVLPTRRRSNNGKKNADEGLERHHLPAQSLDAASSINASSSESRARHSWMGAHKAQQAKVKIVPAPNDPFKRQLSQSDGYKKRRLSLSSSSYANNNSKYTSQVQPGPVNRSLERRFGDSNNHIRRQAQNKVSFSDQNDNVGTRLDAEMTDKGDASYGWGSGESDSEEIPNANKASQKPFNTFNYVTNPYNQSNAEPDLSRREMDPIHNASSTHSAWDMDGEDHHMNNGDEAGGWGWDEDVGDKTEKAYAPIVEQISFAAPQVNSTSNKLSSSSMHPDRIMHLTSSDATLSSAFQEVDIKSPSSPIAQSWRRKGPLPTQIESLGVARNNGGIPTSDSGIKVITKEKYEGLPANAPCSHASSEAGESESRGDRSGSAGGSNKLDVKSLQRAQSWTWNEEIRKVLSNHYHLIPKRKQETNGKTDHVRDTLIQYILHHGGGLRFCLDDRLRGGDRPCVMWVRDPWQPLGDEERQCLMLRNFEFISFECPSDNVPFLRFIWRSKKPQLILYSLGALVCKLIEWHKALRITDEIRKREALNVFKAGDRNTTLYHPWQEIAITALLDNNRMGDFLKQVLGLDEHLAEEFEFMLRDGGISLLKSLDKCSAKYANRAKTNPDEHPGSTEFLPEDLNQFTLELDKEVHSTLLNMQHQLCESYRIFNFTIAGCSMNASHIGTCYSRVDLPTKIDDAE